VLTFTSEVQGLQELQRALDALPDKIAKRLMTRAGRAGGAVFKEQMVNHAPRSGSSVFGQALKNSKVSGSIRYGPLYDHMRITVSFQGVHWMTVKIGPSKGTAFYARFYEYGTIHQPARPFMRPVFDAEWREALNAFAQNIRENLAALAA
jgi:HK97 gp10 family phage protein